MKRPPVLDRAKCRVLVLEALGSGKVNQWATLYNEVAVVAVRKGMAPAGFDLWKKEHQVDRGLVGEVAWELLLEGIFRPTEPESNFAFLSLTEYGTRVVHSTDPTPHDPDRYLAALKKRVPGVHEVTLVYVEEAVRSHRSGNYIAATMMVGVAVEHALVQLAEAMIAWLPGTESANLKKVLEGQRKAAMLFDAIRQRLDVRRAKLPAEVAPHYEVSLLGIGTAIRIARNDAGHPTGSRFDRDDSAQFLMMLPRYLEHAARLTAWMRAEPPGSA